MKKELFNKYCKGELKEIAILNESAFSGIKIVKIIDEKIFGLTFYSLDNGIAEIPFLVKLNGEKFRVDNNTYNLNEFMRID